MHSLSSPSNQPGPEKHQFVAPVVSEESSLECVGMGSVYEKKPVVGDQTAGPVLDCLIYIAHLYGEPVLTYQYLPYIGYLVPQLSADTFSCVSEDPQPDGSHLSAHRQGDGAATHGRNLETLLHHLLPAAVPTGTDGERPPRTEVGECTLLDVCTLEGSEVTCELGVLEELQAVFNPEMAYASYIPFYCLIALSGDVAIRKLVSNHELVWRVVGPTLEDSALKQELPRSGRSLQGNWLAYWQYEIGLNQQDPHFHFHQMGGPFGHG
ncbi:hypothetical protein J4Q44_G00328320 [Coregonus suidteri]|uniref:Uncharacterized protein n=1 Tax=Coregonus suidteri TaxID=861788 RepID=A0AAN8Q9Q3_9TELE